MPDRLVFRLGDEAFGLDTSHIDAVVETDRIYYLPGGTDIVKGVISLRGEPVTVVDSSVLEGGGPAPEAATRKIIVIRKRDRAVGLDIGGAEVDFLWEEEAGEVRPVDCDSLVMTAERILNPEHKRVVIADDSEFFRSSLRQILTSAGFHVVAEAHDGDEAVEMAEVLKPDIVVLDVVMPVKNGLEAAAEINALPERPKIVMCSSLEDKPVVDGALRAGADAYITKPLDRYRIISTLCNLKYDRD